MIRALDLMGGVGWAMEADMLRTMASIAARAGAGPTALQSTVGERLARTVTGRVRGGVAIIPVVGPVFRRANLFTEMSGATSVELLARELRLAVEDPDVHTVLLSIDSPGGEAAGICELAEQIAGYRKQKRIVAYADGACCSGAYWLASACSEIVAGRTAVLGSIGVVLAVGQGAEEGEVVFVSAVSPLKWADPTSEEGAGEYQRRVDELARVFVRDVAKYRNTTPDVVMESYGRGGVLMGAAAVKAGMADRVDSEERLLKMLAKDAGRRPKMTDGGESLEERTEIAARAAAAAEQERVEAATRQVQAAQVEELSRLQTRMAEQEAQIAALEAARAGLERATERRALAEQLGSLRLLEGAAVLAPRSRDALADAVMAVEEPKARYGLTAALTGLALQPVSVIGWSGGDNAVDGAGSTLTAAEERLIEGEAQRKGLKVEDVRRAFIEARQAQVEEGRFVQR